MGEAQWIISWDEFLSTAPSLRQQLSLEEEIKNRRIGTEFIDKLGHSLALNQTTIATAQVFFHRFYLRESFKKFNLNEITLTTTFLAGKVEESPRKLRDVIMKGIEIRFKSLENFTEESNEYKRLYERVIQLEKTVLVLLCFDLTVDHPFRHVAKIFISYPQSFNEEFKKIIWTTLTDSFYTPICLLFPPRSLAIGLLIHKMMNQQVFQDQFKAQQDQVSPVDLLQIILGESSKDWEAIFPKTTKDEVQKIIKFINRPDLPFNL